MSCSSVGLKPLCSTPLRKQINADIDAVAQTHKKLTLLGVLHGDVELRNMLRNDIVAGGGIVVVDFERTDISRLESVPQTLRCFSYRSNHGYSRTGF